MLFLLAFEFFSVQNLFAQDGNIYEIDLNVNKDEVEMIIDALPPISHLPGSPFFPLVSVKEDWEETFKPNQLEKINWKIIISNKRLKESYMLFNNSNKEEAVKNIFAYIESLNEIKDSAERLKSRGDIALPRIALENNLTTQQRILTYFYNEGLEVSASNAIKANIELIGFIKEDL